MSTCPKIRPRFKVGCLFAAIGGFAKAFQQCGAEVVWANEKDYWASETFKANFPGVKHFYKPVETLSVEEDSLEPVDILTAGFPCQPFSIAGEMQGFSDKRGLLFLEIIRIISEFGYNKPKILLLENVKNLKGHDQGRTFRRILIEIQKAGYWLTEANTRILNTSIYTNIPQNRERIFMVALSQDAFSSNSFAFPCPLADGSMLPVRNFLSLDTRPDDKGIYFDNTSQYYQLFLDAIEKDGDDSVYQLRRSYVRRNKSGMCFTLMANMGLGGHNVPVIKDNWGIRKLTPRECARLQGYQDDWFKIPEGMPNRQIYKQIGNSVTVPLVLRIATRILEQLKIRSQKLQYA